MRLVSKLSLLLFLIPTSLLAQPGVRMSADFLPLEVGNRWVYDVSNESGQKTGTLDFVVQEYRIVGGRSFYLVTSFPFVAGDSPTKLIRYDRQERQYVRMLDNEESPLFLADGARAEVLQADESGLPQKFILKMDLMDLTFQRGMGIIEARLHPGNEVQIAKLTSVHVGERQAAQAAAQGAPALPNPAAPATPEQKSKALADNVAKVSEDNPALDVQASDVPGARNLCSLSSTHPTNYCRSISRAGRRMISKWWTHQQDRKSGAGRAGCFSARSFARKPFVGTGIGSSKSHGIIVTMT